MRYGLTTTSRPCNLAVRSQSVPQGSLILGRLYTQVCQEVASVARTADGGLETRQLEPSAEVVESRVGADLC